MSPLFLFWYIISSLLQVAEMIDIHNSVSSFVVLLFVKRKFTNKIVAGHVDNKKLFYYSHITITHWTKLINIQCLVLFFCSVQTYHMYSSHYIQYFACIFNVCMCNTHTLCVLHRDLYSILTTCYGFSTKGQSFCFALATAIFFY